jgi:hypothetical protein
MIYIFIAYLKAIGRLCELYESYIYIYIYMYILYNCPQDYYVNCIFFNLLPLYIYSGFRPQDNCRILVYPYVYGSNMTGTDFFFFFGNHNCQTFTSTCQSSTYSPPESTHFFQRSGSILMPFSKKACLDDGVVVRKPHALQV